VIFIQRYGNFKQNITESFKRILNRKNKILYYTSALSPPSKGSSTPISSFVHTIKVIIAKEETTRENTSKRKGKLMYK